MRPINFCDPRAMNTSDSFYRDLRSFYSFAEVSELAKFSQVPEDWSILITDIRGSTEFIRQGRYKDVNLIGAATISAVLNVADGRSIPFVFGGDGATILVPPSLLKDCTTSLMATKMMAKIRFGMELRIGVVPVSLLAERKAPLLLAKMEIAPGNFLAMIRGAGVTEAEAIVKASTEFQLQGDVFLENADLEGLSCRWAPIPSKNGVILSLLVMVRPEIPTPDILYRDILDQVETRLNPGGQGMPVKLENLKAGSLWENAWREARLQTRRAFWPELGRRILLVAFVKVLLLTKKNLFGVDIQSYVKEVPMNSDYRKFDGLIRMVLDCTESQTDEFEALLHSLHQEGQIFFGLHRSASALMTCFVEEIKNNRHLHFIDGADGGYAIAATQLKGQMAAVKTSVKAS